MNRSLSFRMPVVLSIIFIFIVIMVVWYLYSVPTENGKVWMKLDIVGSDKIDTVWVKPEAVSARSLNRFVFTYVPKREFSIGGKIILKIPWIHNQKIASWSMPQSGDPTVTGFVRVKSSNPETEISTVIYNDTYDYRIHITFTKFPPLPNDTIRIVYGDNSQKDDTMAWSHVRAANYNFPVFVDRQNSNKYLKVLPIPIVKVQPRKVKRIKVILPSKTVEGKEVTAKIVVLDEFNNLSYQFSGSLSLSCLKDTNCGVPPQVVFEKQDSGKVEININPSEGLHQIAAGYSNSPQFYSNPFEVHSLKPEFNLYWGDLQNHSDLSDGTGSLSENYSYARFVSNLDFFALTDHDHGRYSFHMRPEVWALVKAAVDKYNEEDKFVTFLGFEWSQKIGGHRHIIYPDTEGELYPFTKYPTVMDLWSALEGERALTIPHHVAWGDKAVDWTYRNDQYQRLVEIYSRHGANEYHLNSYDHQKEEERAEGHYVRDALAMGHKMGILSSSDGHFGYPGTGWIDGIDATDSTSRGTGLVGVYSISLTRENIFNSIYSRRVFGTTGQRTIIEFKVDGEWMGSEIESEGNPHIMGKVFSKDPISVLEILKFDGKGYTSIPVSVGEEESNIEFSIVDSSFQRTSFYYLRVRTMDNSKNEFAWSSPVWVNKRIADETLKLPSSYSAGNLAGVDIIRQKEIVYQFSVNHPPYTNGGELSFESYGINNSTEVSLYVNGIFIDYLKVDMDTSWSKEKHIKIPRFLIGNKNLARFEYSSDYLNEYPSDWGIRNVRYVTRK